MARHSIARERFSLSYERASIDQGIQSELQRTVGQYVHWFVFDPASSELDSIYDVGSLVQGRQWKRAVKIPAFGAFIYQGRSTHSVRGFYNTDVLRASFSAPTLTRYLPDLVSEPDEHIWDRIAYRGQLYVPTVVNLRGLLDDRYTVVTIDAMQVKEEESVNDSQLNTNQYPYQVIGSQNDAHVTDFANQEPLPQPRSLEDNVELIPSGDSFPSDIYAVGQ